MAPDFFSFPKSLDTIYGGADVLANRLRAMTGGKFDIRVFPGGEIVPGLQALDAVQQGTVECCHTCSYYYVGKDKTFGFGTSVPFGMNARQMNAWIYYGGGQKLLDEFLQPTTTSSLLCRRQHGYVQMGGWFRKEVKSLEDVKGLKMRIAGLGGNVFAEHGRRAATDRWWRHLPGPGKRARSMPPSGSVPTTTRSWASTRLPSTTTTRAGGNPGPVIHFFVNKKEWEKLPKEYQEAFQAAAYEANVTMMAEYDHKNPIGALQAAAELASSCRPSPKDVMEAAYKAAQQICTLTKSGKKSGLQENLHRVRQVPEDAERLVQRGRSAHGRIPAVA